MTAAEAGSWPDMTEKALQGQIDRELRAAGWRCYHTWISARSTAGYPDLTAVHQATRRLVFAELKRRGKVPTDKQAEWLADLEAAGAEVWLVTPDNLGAFYASLIYGQPATDADRRPDRHATT